MRRGRPGGPVSPADAAHRLMAGAAILEGTIRRCLPPGIERQEALAHVAAALAVSLELAKAREAVDVGG